MTPQEMAVWINLYRKNDERYSDRHLREASEMLNKLQTENQSLNEQNGLLIIRLGQLQAKNAKLDREVTRYKMAWNMAEDEIEKLKTTITELEYVNSFGDLDKDK